MINRRHIMFIITLRSAYSLTSPLFRIHLEI